MGKENIKPQNHDKYDYAFLLFMNQTQLKDICDKVGTTPATLKKWRTQGEWDTKRATKIISLDDLISKILEKAAEELDKDDFNADSFAKIISQLKSLKGGTIFNDRVMVYMEFGEWLRNKIGTDPNVEGDFLKKVVTYQDLHLKSERDGKD